MKKVINISIILYTCTVALNVSAVNGQFQTIDSSALTKHTEDYTGASHTVTNSTDYNVEVYMKWYRIHLYNMTMARPFYVKDNISPHSCITINHIYYNYNRPHCNKDADENDENCIQWRYFDNPVVLFNSDLVILVNDSEQNAFDRVLDGGVLGNYEVIGDKKATLGLFDSFDLTEYDDTSKSSEQCKIFHPTNAFYADGDTILHHMIRTRQETDVVRAWLSSGAPDVNLKNEDGVTPMELALEKQNEYIILLLLEYGATMPPIENNTDTSDIITDNH